MTRPGWFTMLAGALVLWGLAGCASFVFQMMMEPPGDAWDREFIRALPAWYGWDYAVAVAGGLFGSISLLARSRLAVPLYWVSLIAVLVQFGYVFLATDLLAHKGAAMTLPFPIFIIAVAILQVLLAAHAERRGWIA